MSEPGGEDAVYDADAPREACRYADLRADFDELGADHVALFYDTPDAQRRVAAAFVESALHRNQQCLYLTDRNEAGTIREAFRRAGIEVEAREAAGDLRILPAAEVYLDDGFDPGRLVDTLTAAAEASVTDDYDGFAAIGENSWSFRADADFDEIIEFEAAFDAHQSDYPVATLCQYGLEDFDETAIAKALRTHEHVVYRETLCRNPYYLPPERYAGATESRLNATLMLEQTYGLARSRRAVERHEQRLAVVSRILRHDIRNDLNLVLGTLSMLRESASLDPPDRARLDRIDRTASRLADRAEKARYVQRTLTDSTVERFDLGTVIDDAVETVRAEYPSATVAASADPGVTVLADGHLEAALVELLTNAVVHGTAEPPEATLRTVHDGDTVTVEVANPGPPVPESGRTALKRGLETPLEHADGLGLWLVKWVADNSRGRLHFPEADPGECRIAVDLRVVD
ncbi:MEDS domain-containing protein [Haloplanus pelagicus]|jgi:signal transduction histidine kinase|uniref:MEDS domain-containing protein n=1 Tax=Haloplanus pelagicus TaxID=2949995 RepID=UPI00203F9668|nr:MEDS domain-containing protein [Haloplanus sp. HW8-1]